jgi:hypothetical protein
VNIQQGVPFQNIPQQAIFQQSIPTQNIPQQFNLPQRPQVLHQSHLQGLQYASLAAASLGSLHPNVTSNYTSQQNQGVQGMSQAGYASQYQSNPGVQPVPQQLYSQQFVPQQLQQDQVISPKDNLTQNLPGSVPFFPSLNQGMPLTSVSLLASSQNPKT